MQRWYTLLVTQLAALASMPLLLVGFTLARQASTNTIIITVIINALLGILFSVLLMRALNGRSMTTPQLFNTYIGSCGTIVVPLLLAFSSLVWFVVHIDFLIGFLIAQFSLPSTVILRSGLYLLLLSVGIVATRSGTYALARLGYVAAALLAILSGAAFVALKDFAIPHELSLFNAILMLHMIVLFTIYNTPTFYQNSASIKDSIISSVLLYSLFVPLIIASGYVLALVNPSAMNLTECCASGSKLFVTTALLFFIISGIANLINNLFAAEQAMRSLPRLQSWALRIALCSFLVTLMLYSGMTDNLLIGIGYASISICALGSLVVAQELFVHARPFLSSRATIFILASSCLAGLIGKIALTDEYLPILITLATTYILVAFFYVISYRTATDDLQSMQ